MLERDRTSSASQILPRESQLRSKQSGLGSILVEVGEAYYNAHYISSTSNQSPPSAFTLSTTSAAAPSSLNRLFTSFSTCTSSSFFSPNSVDTPAPFEI